jgi:Cytochrome P460
MKFLVEKGSAMKRKSKLTIAIATTVVAVLGAAAVYAQDKYSLKSPSGIAFSDFRGYEDWAVVSSARTDEILKVIVANPKMIKAYKAGIPGNGQPFPDGSMIAKLQWKLKKSTEAPFVVEVPDVFSQAFLMEKDSKRFPKSGGWGYAVFNYEAASDKFTPDPKSLSDCGYACHTPVKAKDYIFHPYQKR